MKRKRDRADFDLWIGLTERNELLGVRRQRERPATPPRCLAIPIQHYAYLCELQRYPNGVTEDRLYPLVRDAWLGFVCMVTIVKQLARTTSRSEDDVWLDMRWPPLRTQARRTLLRDGPPPCLAAWVRGTQLAVRIHVGLAMERRP